jgi:hypothetical protein
MIRRGAFDVTGTPCNSSLGPVNLSGNIPQLGEPFTIEVDNAPTAAAFLLGLQSVNVDLTAAGMTGCTLHTLPSLVIPAAAVSNVATMTIPMRRTRACSAPRGITRPTSWISRRTPSAAR